MRWYKISQAIRETEERNKDQRQRVKDWHGEALKSCSYSWGVLNKQDIIKIYALEYKIAQLSAKGEYLSGNDYILYNKYYQEALQLSNKLIPNLLDIVESWMNYHGFEPDVEKDVYDLAKFIQVAWGYLRSASSPKASLKEKFNAINFAIHVIHNSDQSLAMLSDFELIPNPKDFNYDSHDKYEELVKQTKNIPHDEWQLLDDLSEGKFIPEWQKELNQRAKNHSQWYKLALHYKGWASAYWIAPDGEVFDTGGDTHQGWISKSYEILQMNYNIDIVEEIQEEIMTEAHEYIEERIAELQKEIQEMIDNEETEGSQWERAQEEFAELTSEDSLEYAEDAITDHFIMTKWYAFVMNRLLDNDWVRVVVKHNQVHVEVDELSDNSKLQRISDFLFSANLAPHIEIRLGEKNGWNEAVFQWEDFVQSGSSLADYVNSQNVRWKRISLR